MPNESQLPGKVKAALGAYFDAVLKGEVTDPKALEQKVCRDFGIVDGSEEWELLNRIAFEPARKVRQEKQATSKCFIATAACGSADDSDVETLRYLRDHVVLKYRPGQKLVRVYERMSPAIAARIVDRPVLRWLIRFLVIRPVVCGLELRRKLFHWTVSKL